MMTKYVNCTIADEVIDKRLKELTNQIYKLLPNREEGIDWRKPLLTIIEELTGMSLLLQSQDNFFPLLCKLLGLLCLVEEKDFMLYRRTIFECLGYVGRLRHDFKP